MSTELTIPALKASVAQSGSCTSIPSIFCWTKIGSEAGQGLTEIIRRKDLERECGSGVFAWGIGNSVGSAIKHAMRAERVSVLEALFTPMKSPPKPIDSAPRSIVMWTSFLADTGETEHLPEHMLVTSRAQSESGEEKRGHYALICRSTDPLAAQRVRDTIDHRSLCNLVSSNPVGASQNTSVVRYRPAETCGTTYSVLFRAELTGRAFVRLATPVTLKGDLLDMYRALCATDELHEWKAQIRALKAAAAANAPDIGQQSLFA